MRMNVLTAATLAALALALLTSAPSALAQDAGEIGKLRAEIEALKKGQQAIQGQLKAIQDLLVRATRPPPRQSPVETVATVLKGAGDDPVLGDAGAPLTLVEYSDYQCPFCRRHALTTMAKIKKELIDTGKIRYVFRDFPIAQIHPNAPKAAEAANCAGDQGKYWAMHDRLFRNPNNLAAADLPGHAAAIGLDGAAFAACLASGRHEAEIRQDMADGNAAGVRGTPTFFVAVPGDRPGTLKTMRILRGALPFAAFKQAVDASLADLAKAEKAKRAKSDKKSGG